MASTIEAHGSVAIVEPANSDYRTSAEILGYDRRSMRHLYEFEADALFVLGSRFYVGPAVRLQAGRMGSPYAGVDPISSYVETLSARVELEAYSYPRLFLWAEPSIGIATVGVPGAHTTVGTYGVRGGVGIAGSIAKVVLRLRVGYAYSPTMTDVTKAGGKLDFGGFVFAIDGGYRASK